METIQLSYLLYNLDEVKYSFMLSLLFQNNHTLSECLFWAYELHKSKQSEFLWNFIAKIYYDFYYIKGASFERQINIEYNAWKKSGDFQHIAKIVKELHKQNADITIFHYLHANTNTNTNINTNTNTNTNINTNTNTNNDDEIKMEIKSNDDITSDILKNNIEHSISYLHTQSAEDVKYIYTSLYKVKRNNDMCLFYENQKHRWIVKLISKLEKRKKVWIKTKLTNADIKQIAEFEAPIDHVYKTLKIRRLYEINPLVGGFNLARFKGETDVVKVWDKTHYTFSDVDRYISAYLHNWEFYARTTPFWKKIFDTYQIKFVKKKPTFPNVDLLESFYDAYGFEPDEQSRETQYKSIRSIEKQSICNCFKKYNVEFNSKLLQITY